MIASCTAISNCNESNWFNNCSQCETGYVWNYDRELGV